MRHVDVKNEHRVDEHGLGELRASRPTTPRPGSSAPLQSLHVSMYDVRHVGAPMKTVALVAQKGGTGKSMLAIHLAVCASRRGHLVALIELDQQDTVKEWRAVRATDDLEVVSAQASWPTRRSSTRTS